MYRRGTGYAHKQLARPSHVWKKKLLESSTGVEIQQQIVQKLRFDGHTRKSFKLVPLISYHFPTRVSLDRWAMVIKAVNNIASIFPIRWGRPVDETNVIYYT